MKQVTKYSLLVWILILVQLMDGQENKTGEFSLQQSIEYATKHSPNFLNAELDLKSAEYRRKEITGTGLPQISGSIDLKDYLAIPTSLLPGQIFGGPEGTFIPVKFGTKFNSTAGFSASQLIFSSDYIFGLKASKEFMNLSRINVMRSKSELAAQVTKAYYTAVISKERFKLLEANITRLKKMYGDTKASNQQGLVELIDVERLEVQLNNLTADRERTQKLIGLSETTLKFQMGYNLNDPIVLADSLNIQNEFQELNVNKIDISQRPEYQLYQAQQTLYDLDVKRLKYSYLPTLAAYGSYQYNAQRSEFNFLQFDKSDPTKQWFKVALVGVTLNMSIFTGFQRVNKIEQAQITALKNQNSLKNIEFASQMEATVAGINYNNAYTSLLSQKRNIELANHVVEVAQKKYESGVGSNIEVVTAETALIEAQTNYYNAVFDMVVAKTDYQKASGTLVK